VKNNRRVAVSAAAVVFSMTAFAGCDDSVEGKIGDYDGGSGYIDESTSIMSDDGLLSPDRVPGC
jgi:hypothetical protein